MCQDKSYAILVDLFSKSKKPVLTSDVKKEYDRLHGGNVNVGLNLRRLKKNDRVIRDYQGRFAIWTPIIET